MPKSILLIGTMPPPVHGQSNCFQLVVDSFPNAFVADRNVDQHGLFSKTIKYGKALLKSLYALFLHRPNLVYISLSRSLPGLGFDSIVILISKLLGYSIHGHLHGNDFLDRKWKQLLFGKIYGFLDSFIVLSPAMVNRISERIDVPVETLINPVDNVFFKPVSSKPDNKEDKTLRIVFFSNFMRSKGIIDFMNLAISLVGEEKYEFHVIGDMRSDYTASKEAMRSEFNDLLGKAPNTTYHGALSDDKLVDQLRKMDVMIFASYHFSEAFPLTVMECAASGQFIVVNDHNDLSVFEKIIPNVKICDTTDTESLAAWLKIQDKRILNKHGEENAQEMKKYSASEHIRNLKKLVGV